MNPLIATCRFVTPWLHIELLPHWSGALQVRVAIKMELQSPLVVVPTVTMLTFVPSARSEAIGSSKLHALPQMIPLVLAQLSTGGVVSITLTAWLQLVRLLQLSTASQVRRAVKVFPQKLDILVTVLTTRT